MRGRHAENKNDSFFFQRFYDEISIEQRLLRYLPGYQIEAKELFGEIDVGFFRDYEKRWIEDGLAETVKDPWYMATKMRNFPTIDALPGLGVMGLVLQKPL